MRLPLECGHADLDADVVVRGDERLLLSPNEALLLRYLAERPGQTVSQVELLQEVFGFSEKVRSRTVVTTMQRLRTKVEEDPADPVHLLNVYGRGYRFQPLGAASGLIGRSTELAEIRTRLGDGRLWVVAPGGFGKSRLAQHAAAHFGAPTLWVDLTDTSSEAGLTAAVARALHLERLEDAGAVKLALAHYAPTVIVFDAAEALGPALAPWLQIWCEVAPTLVTSRVPCPGEATLNLGPLGTEDAARLFAQRAPGTLAP